MGDLTQKHDNISINNPYWTEQTLRLDDNTTVLVENSSQIILKFPLPKVKIVNDFPTSVKTLTSIMKDINIIDRNYR